MKNAVTQIFDNLTDAELSLAILEMREDSETGIIRENGMLRKTAKAVHEIVGGTVYEHMMMTQFSILQEAAYRFTPHPWDL
jgi:hypothetical protein